MKRFKKDEPQDWSALKVGKDARHRVFIFKGSLCTLVNQWFTFYIVKDLGIVNLTQPTLAIKSRYSSRAVVVWFGVVTADFFWKERLPIIKNSIK